MLHTRVNTRYYVHAIKMVCFLCCMLQTTKFKQCELSVSPYIMDSFLPTNSGLRAHWISAVATHNYSSLSVFQHQQRQLGLDWIEQCFTSHQHSIGYMEDGFYRSKDPTNSIKVLKVHIVHRQIKRTIIKQQTQNTANPLVYTNMGWLRDGSHRGQRR